VRNLFVKHIHDFDEGMTLGGGYCKLLSYVEDAKTGTEINNPFKSRYHAMFGSHSKSGETKATIGAGDIVIINNPAELAETNRDLNAAQHLQTNYDIQVIQAYFFEKHPEAYKAAVASLKEKGISGFLADLATVTKGTIEEIAETLLPTTLEPNHEVYAKKAEEEDVPTCGEGEKSCGDADDDYLEPVDDEVLEFDYTDLIKASKYELLESLELTEADLEIAKETLSDTKSAEGKKNKWIEPLELSLAKHHNNVLAYSMDILYHRLQIEAKSAGKDVAAYVAENYHEAIGYTREVLEVINKYIAKPVGKKVDATKEYLIGKLEESLGKEKVDNFRTKSSLLWKDYISETSNNYYKNMFPEFLQDGIESLAIGAILSKTAKLFKAADKAEELNKISKIMEGEKKLHAPSPVHAAKLLDGNIYKELSALYSNQIAKVSEVIALAESKHWKIVKSNTGPIKFVDSQGTARLTIKQGSARTAGSETPHIEIRNAEGIRVDMSGKPVSRRSKENHTPIEWDIKE
jgi:hypothetical protein